MPNPTARRTVGLAAAVVFLFILLAVNVAVLILGRQTQRDAAAVAATVADCQNTSGACYARSQQRIADFLRQQHIRNLYLVQCAKVTNTDAELEACVEQRLKAAAASSPPAPTPSAAQDDDQTP